IMQLRDRGLLSLGDPLTEYLPELKSAHNPYGSMDDLTIKMALEHSTGFRNPTWPWGGGEGWHPFEPTEWDQLAAMLPYSELLFEPGSRHSYSNPAIIFLGKIIEIVTGDVYEAYIDKNILKPLGMYQSYFDNTPYHLLPQRSNSYTLHEKDPVPNGLDFNTGITVSNGGLNSPISDMTQYLGFLTGSHTEHEILDRSSLEEMWEIQHEIEEEDGIRSSAGLSFFIEEFEGMRVIGHTGTQRSFYSFFYIHPESGTAVLGITNTEGREGEPDMFQFREDLVRYIFQNLFTLYR
ncbi:MAG: serine hydrolase domain-containing protein, partial [Balneolaceae bacterium]